MENKSYDKDRGNYTKKTLTNDKIPQIRQMEIEKVISDHQYVQLKNTYSTTFINDAQFQEITPIQMQRHIRKEKQQ